MCEKYVARQTVKPFQHLVLDDGMTQTKPTLGQEYHFWPEVRGRGSLSKKMRKVMTDGLVKGDAIIWFEDDDYYPADYIEWCIKGLSRVAIFGEGRALYYNVQFRCWFEHVNLRHASLCASSITRAAFPHLLKQVTTSECPFLDVRLWNKPPVSAQVIDPYRDPSRYRHSVGIKAMPGRTGYGGGHVGRDRASKDDFDLAKLRSLIGADADNYAKFFIGPTAAAAKPLPPEKNMHTAPTVITRPGIAKSECGRVHGPNWLQWLAPFKGQQNVIGIEIGTFEGDSAEFMLENVFYDPTSKYHCIDPFTGAADHKFHKIDVSQIEDKARAKLARFPNVEIHKGFSHEVLRGMTEKVHFVYVDGDHSTRGVMRDAVLGFDLLVRGGVMVFDDYQWNAMPNELDRPKLAIDTFVRCYAREIRVLQPRGYQIAIQKKE
jgi:hypothetical protein